MGFTLSQLGEKNKQRLAYTFEDGDVFHYWVSVNRMSFSMMNRLRAAASELGTMEEDEDDSRKQEAVIVLMELMVDWDLVDEDGNKAPIDKDNVLSLPLSMLTSMLETIMESISPNPQSATSSSGGTSTRKSRKSNTKLAEVPASRTGSA